MSSFTVSNSDYQSFDLTMTFSVTLRSHSVTVEALSDSSIENTETMFVNVSSPGLMSLSTAIFITDQTGKYSIYC